MRCKNLTPKRDFKGSIVKFCVVSIVVFCHFALKFVICLAGKYLDIFNETVELLTSMAQNS